MTTNSTIPDLNAQWDALWLRMYAVLKAPDTRWTAELVLRSAGVDQYAAVWLGGFGRYGNNAYGGVGISSQEDRRKLSDFLDTIDERTPGKPSALTVFEAFKLANGRRLYQANLAMFMLDKLPPLSGAGLVLSQAGTYDALSTDAKALIDELFVRLRTEAEPPLQLTTADVQFIGQVQPLAGTGSTWF